MSRTEAAVTTVLEELSEAGLTQAEVYAKKGRSRRAVVRPEGEEVGFSDEAGWAVRAGSERASFFATGTGELRPQLPWPEPDGLGLRLPRTSGPASNTAGSSTGGWSPPASLEAPLLGEREGLELLRSISRDLENELAGAQLTEARLEEGASESTLRSSQGVRAAWRSRVAALRLEATWRAPAGSGPAKPSPSITATFFGAEREARAFHPRALARRLAARLTVAATGTPPEPDRAELLLAPEVATRVLAGLTPLLCGPEAAARAASLTGSGDRFASKALTVIDDGRLPGGTFEAPFDGEGMPTRKVTLVEEGRYQRPLLSYSETSRESPPPSGCARRASWRDLPRSGPTHLYVQPRADLSVAELVRGMERGYYLIDVGGAGYFDIAADRFSLPVRGFAVDSGRATGPIASATVHGTIRALLRGVQATARDLTFLPLDGMIGSPTLLVHGLSIGPQTE